MRRRAYSAFLRVAVYWRRPSCDSRRAAVPLSEKLLIQRMRRAAAAGRTSRTRHRRRLCCSAVPRGHEALVTTDFSLEGVHFRREWHPPDSVGHRCLARGLSDIAAMGGIPRAAFLSLALPAELPQEWVDRFIAGLLKLARRFSVRLAGGDTAQSPDGVLADIVVLGSVPAGQAILRSGARAGDFIYVTGTLGSAMADSEPAPRWREAAPEVPPEALLSRAADCGRAVPAREEAGLRDDRHQRRTFHRSGTHLRGKRDRRRSVSPRRCRPLPGKDGLTFALHGGDEYELLFTAHPKRRIPKQIAGVPVTRIGEITRGKQMKLATANGKTEILQPGGWEHFAIGIAIQTQAATIQQVHSSHCSVSLRIAEHPLFRGARCL